MKSTPMTEAMYDYLVANFAEDERRRLREMAAPAEKAGLPLIMISEDQARFVGFLLSTMRARRALDIGTLFGYSAATMALAMGPEGRVTSLELEPRNADVARASLERLGLGGRVDIIVGAAQDTMRTLPSAAYDFILIDADKGGYERYFTESLRLIKPGGIIAADNTLAWGRVNDERAQEPDIVAIQKFNRQVATRTDVDACLLPIGDGLLLARMKP